RKLFRDQVSKSAQIDHAFERPVIQEQKNNWQRNQHRFRHQPASKQDRYLQVAADRWFARVIQIRGEREHKEESTQNVFAFGNPDDRLHPQRMDGKDRRHECASPKRAGQPTKQVEENDSSRGVEQNISEMMRPSAEPEHSTIEHVRKRRERMPVTSMSMSKCPNHSIPTQARDYLRSFIGVGRIIIIHEGKMAGLSKDKPNERNKAGADTGYERKLSGFFSHRLGPDRAMEHADDKDRSLLESEGRGHVDPDRSPFQTPFAQFLWLSQTDLLQRRPLQEFECRTDYFAA